jgi:hypothetical protein
LLSPFVTCELYCHSSSASLLPFLSLYLSLSLSVFPSSLFRYVVSVVTMCT